MQPDLALTLFTILVLIYSIIIHEVAHGYAALSQGDVTAKYSGRLTLNPLRHVDPIGSILLPALLVLTRSPFLFGWAKPVPYNPANLRSARWGEALVSIAGIATNLIIALVFAVVARAAVGAGNEVFAQLAAVVVLVNLFLGLFNALPIPPFDGFTFLRSVLPVQAGLRLRSLEAAAERGGFVTLFAVLLLFSFFLSAPFSALVGVLFSFLIGA